MPTAVCTAVTTVLQHLCFLLLIDYEKMAERILSQWLVHSAIWTSPRIPTPTEVAPDQLKFMPIISEGVTAAAAVTDAKIYHRNIQFSPMNLEFKCSLSKQRKCHYKGEYLFSCSNVLCSFVPLADIIISWSKVKRLSRIKLVRSGIITMQSWPALLRLCCWHGWPQKATMHVLLVVEKANWHKYKSYLMA